MKKILIAVIFLASKTLSGQVLHFIPITHTLDAVLGASASTVLVHAKKRISEIAELSKLQLKMSEYECSGNNFNKAAVERVLNNLQVGSDDVIVLHIFGHGYRSSSQQSKFPNVGFGGGASNFSTQSEADKNAISGQFLVNTLQAKKARLLVVLIEACNKTSTRFYEPDRDKSAWFKYSNMEPAQASSVENALNLFRNTKGVIAACSASPEEFAFVPTPINGTPSLFFEQFNRIIGGAVKARSRDSWDVIFEKIKIGVAEDFKTIPSIDRGNQQTQTPYYDIRIERNSTQVTPQAVQAVTVVQTQADNAHLRYFRQMELGRAAFHRRNIQGAISYFEAALREKPGDPEATGNINACHAHNGAMDFVNYNYEEACQVLSGMEDEPYFTEQRYVYTQYCLAIMYLKGRGCKKNMKKAEFWLRTASNNGLSAACQILNKYGVYDCN